MKSSLARVCCSCFLTELLVIPHSNLIGVYNGGVGHTLPETECAPNNAGQCLFMLVSDCTRMRALFTRVSILFVKLDSNSVLKFNVIRLLSIYTHVFWMYARPVTLNECACMHVHSLNVCGSSVAC